MAKREKDWRAAPPGLRPVSARALKSVGDTLRPYLYGATVLDLFAGQGRFGRMALDEGARRATFVEKDRRTARELEDDVARYGESAIVACDDAFRALAAGGTYDICFADPPFASWDATFAAQLFAAVARCLKPGAIFLVKFPKRMVLSTTFSEFSFWKDSPFGESKLMYFRYGKSDDTREQS